MKALELLLYTYATRDYQRQTHPISIWAYEAATWIDDALRPMVKRFAEWRAKRRVVAELNGLTDTLLRDIGIERDQIVAVVEERWNPAPSPVRAAVTALPTFRLGTLKDLPTASNDDNVDSAA